MNRTLIDAGPLIALFNNSDRYHRKITDFFAGIFRGVGYHLAGTY